MAGNKSTNGSNIEKRRQELGMSQGQLAKLMNISVGQISRWELGGCVPHVDTLKKMAEILDCDWKSLVG